MSDPLESFDLDDPKLPKAIKRAALTSDGYPYAERIDPEQYATKMLELQKQLVLLQAHLAETGERVVIVFEGRDAAGKGGAIRSYLKKLNPRLNLVAALPRPSDREQTQWYFQRYVDWLPAAGESVLFDRSWYNRAGVETVMGYCTPEETERFLVEAPRFEQMLVNDGIHFFKFWLSIGREMQLKRFHERRHNPLKSWKLSKVDLVAIEKWDAYTDARNRMFEGTNTDYAPWLVVRANDKRRARLNVIRSVLSRLKYVGKDAARIGEVDQKIVDGSPKIVVRNSEEKSGPPEDTG